MRGRGRKTDICVLLPSLGTGGAEKVGVNLANYYASLGLGVDLVAIQSMGRYRNLVAGGVDLIDLDAKRARYSVLGLRRYLKARKPERVLSVLRRTNIYLALASLALGKRPDLYFREASPLRDLAIEGASHRRIQIFLMKLCYRKASKVIANSEATKADLARFRIPGAARSPVIHNPVLPLDVDALSAETVAHPWFADPALKVVLSVGRLFPAKDQATLIKAFKAVADRHPGARLLILGEGPEKPRLEKCIADLGLAGKAMLHPFVDNPFPYYRHSAVFALTSLWEGFGNVIVEALSAGTPIVCADCPGGPRMILAGGRYGALVEPGNASAFAEAILRALDGEGDRDARKLRARDFTVAGIGAEYAQAMGMALP